MIKIVKYTFGCLFITLFLVGCKKQVPGDKGAKGSDGYNGNANQTVDASFLILSQAWLTNNVKKDWNTDYFTTAISEAVIQNAAISLYVQVDGAWFPLPYTKEDFHLQYNLQPGSLHLNFFKSHQVANQPASMNFRLVIVSPK